MKLWRGGKNNSGNALSTDPWLIYVSNNELFWLWQPWLREFGLVIIIFSKKKCVTQKWMEKQ